MDKNKWLCTAFLAALGCCLLCVPQSARAAENSGVVVGVVSEKGATHVRVREQAGRNERYDVRWVGGDAGSGGGLDSRIVDKLKTLEVGSTVRMSWRRDEKLRIVDFVITAGPAERRVTDKDGVLIGMITEKGGDFVVVKPKDGDAMRFIPQWVGGKEGGFDKEIIKALAQRKVGDRVYTKWFVDNEKRRRLVEFRPAKEGETVDSANKPTATAPAMGDTGTVIGTVEDKGEVYLSIRVDGKTERYICRMLPARNNKPAHLDPELLRQIAQAKLGQKVQVKWVYDDLKRIQELSLDPIEDVPASVTTEPVIPGEYFEGQQGVVIGVVTEKSDTWFIINSEEEQPQSMKFIPRWIGGALIDGGGMDKEMLKNVRQVRVGQRVEVKWLYQESLRVVQLTHLPDKPPEKKVENKPAENKPAEAKPEQPQRGQRRRGF